jgi:hypothetical protein
LGKDTASHVCSIINESKQMDSGETNWGKFERFLVTWSKTSLFDEHCVNYARRTAGTRSQGWPIIESPKQKQKIRAFCGIFAYCQWSGCNRILAQIRSIQKFNFI